MNVPHRLAGITLALLLACAQAPTEKLTTAPFVSSLGEARAMAAQKDQPILLKFYTDW